MRNIQLFFYFESFETQQISISTPLGQADFLGDLQNALRQGGIETCIRNALVLAKRKQDVKDERENLNYMKKSQVC